MSNLLEDIKKMMAAENFDAALDRLAGMDLHTNPYLLLRAATCEQLADRGSLERAKAHLDELVTRYPDFVSGLIDLGYFQFAMNNDARAALPIFDTAIAQARKDLREATIGKAKCLIELGDRDGAFGAVGQLALPLSEEREILTKLELVEP